MIILLASLDAPGQVKSLSGSIGGLVQRNYYRDDVSRWDDGAYRQQILLDLKGSVYNHNLIDYSLRTSLENSNASFSGRGAKVSEHFLSVNYYDLSALFFKRKRFPLSLYARRDLAAREVSGAYRGPGSHSIISNGFGGDFSYSLNNGSLPRIFLGYNQQISGSLTPEYPFSQLDRNYNAGISQTVGKTSYNLRYDHQGAYDRVRNVSWNRDRLNLQHHSDLKEQGQLVTNAHWEQYLGSGRIRWNTYWSRSFSPDVTNTAALDFERIGTGAYSNHLIGLSDALSLQLSPAWSSSVHLSHSVGRVGSGGASKPAGMSSVNGGLVFGPEGGKLRPSVSTRAQYARRSGDFTNQQFGGSLSVGLTSTHWSALTVTVSDQISGDRYVNGVSYSLVSNVVTGSLTTSVIPGLTLAASGNAIVTRQAGGHTPLNRSDYRANVNASFQLYLLTRMYLNGGYSFTSSKADYFSQVLHQYSWEVIIPQMVRDLQVSVRGTRSRDVFTGAFYSMNDLSLTYRMRAIFLTARWLRNSFGAYTSNQYQMTIARPFDISFE